MGVLPFSCRDGAGASTVGFLAPKAISVICFELDMSYGKVIEGRRQFWHSGKNIDIQNSTLRTREE